MTQIVMEPSHVADMFYRSSDGSLFIGRVIRESTPFTVCKDEHNKPVMARMATFRTHGKDGQRWITDIHTRMDNLAPTPKEA